MATATKTTPKSEYTLSLTQEEAQALFDVIGVIEGDPATTRRKYTSAIYWALNAVGFTFVTRQPDLTAEIRFL